MVKIMKIINEIYFKSPTSLQNFMISTYGRIIYKRRYEGIYYKIRNEIDRLKSLNKGEVKALQERLLYEMIKYCITEIPYYKNLCSDFGLTANDFTTIEDLKKLPTLDKQTLLAQKDNFRPRNGPKPFIVQHTSGSTGTPLSLHVDEHTYKLAMALLVDHEENHGVPFGSRRATFAGRMLKPINDMTPPFSRFNRPENQRLFSSYHLNEMTFPHYKNELNRFQPEELIGYPSAICNLADHYLKTDSEPGFRLKAVITNSETLLVWQREKIEFVFGCPVYDYYGTAEYVMFAGQDQKGIYRPSPIIGISEVEVSDDSKDTGRLLATSLTNKQMPLLRYSLGDTATLASVSEASIGAPALRSVNGRTDDYIETLDGRLIGRIDHIFKGVEGIREAQVVQSQAGWATIKLVAHSRASVNECGLLSNCKQRLGEDFQATIEYVERIPRGRNGKFRSVVRRQAKK